MTTTFSRSVSLGGVHDSDNQSTLRYQTSVRSNIAKPKPIATNNLPPCELPASTNPKGYCLIHVISSYILFYRWS